MSPRPESKTLLPETLPTPEARGAGSPRERVEARLRRIAAKGVAAGGLAVCMSCVAVDPLPPPADVVDTGASDTGGDATADDVQRTDGAAGDVQGVGDAGVDAGGGG